jgi:hypothetical protein
MMIKCGVVRKIRPTSIAEVDSDSPFVEDMDLGVSSDDVWSDFSGSSADGDLGVGSEELLGSILGDCCWVVG